MEETQLLNTKEAAKLLSITPSWLIQKRGIGGGPPFIKLSGAVRYKKKALMEWLDALPELKSTAQAKIKKEAKV